MEISKMILKKAVKEVWVRSLTEISPDILESLYAARKKETNIMAQKYLDIMIENALTATKNHTVICQDSGVPTFFVKTPLNFPYSGPVAETFAEALRELTLSEFVTRPMVVHPVTRFDNCDNTGSHVPIIHTELVSGQEYMEITAMPKGAGTGNWGTLHFFTLNEGMAAVKKFIIDSVIRAGSNPCPPLIVGVGIGGTLEEVARLATYASIRPVNVRHPEENIAELECELFNALNMSEIGVMGLGGNNTVLAVNIEYSGTHKPWLPVAVNINCWPGRKAACRIKRDGQIEQIRY